MAGKVADARTAKALKDLYDGLNAVSMEFTGKTINGLNNTISNIRAAQLYGPDKKEVDSATFSIGFDNSVNGHLKTMGAPVKFLAFGVPYFPHSSMVAGLEMYPDGEITYSAMPLKAGDIVTGLKFPMFAQGDYVADVKFNGGGLYKFANGVLTLVAISANMPNIWKTPAKQFSVIPFTSPYTVPESGLYYASSMYSATTPNTQPQLIYFPSMFNINFNSVGFANNAFIFAKSGYDGASLPTSINATDPAMRRNDFPEPIWVGGY